MKDDNVSVMVVTMDAIRDMNATMLLGWVQRRLRVPLDDEDKAKLLGAKITGSAFLQGAKDRSLFREAGLAVGPSADLSELAKAVVDSESPTRRRRHSSSETFAARVKRSKVVKLAPSALAKPTEYEKLQNNPEERILDDRPQDDDIPPASLLYEGFGQFMDIVAGRPVDGCNNVNAFDLHLAVDEFAESMCLFYPNEDTRAKFGRTYINKILAARRDGFRSTITAASIGPVNSTASAVRTDGHFTGHHGVAVIINEFKNRSAGNSGLPEVEMVGYFAHSFADSSCLERFPKLEGWRVPAVAITIVGSDVKFYGILSLGTQFRPVGLTPAFSCIRSASEGRDRNGLYRAFTATSFLDARIFKDYGVKDVPQKISDYKDIRLPSISSLLKWQNSDTGSNDSVKIKFRIKERYGDAKHSRLLNLAETDDGQTILVKFTRQYCPELHEICAASGHAPFLLAYEPLPGGWYGVGMEYVVGAVPITLHKKISVHIQQWEEDLRQLISQFHNRDFVHGDLRDTNVISGDDGCVKLVDFDWGGKDGQVSYPTPNLNPDLTKGRSTKDLVITKADDLRILEDTLALVRYLLPTTTAPPCGTSECPFRDGERPRHDSIAED